MNLAVYPESNNILSFRSYLQSIGGTFLRHRVLTLMKNKTEQLLIFFLMKKFCVTICINFSIYIPIFCVNICFEKFEESNLSLTTNPDETNDRQLSEKFQKLACSPMEDTQIFLVP